MVVGHGTEVEDQLGGYCNDSGGNLNCSCLCCHNDSEKCPGLGIEQGLADALDMWHEGKSQG